MNDYSLNSNDIVEFIGDIFRRRGADSYLGEKVSMSEHMLQAAQLAEQEGADELLIAAALLHDIGHYTNEFPEDALEKGINNHHDTAGAAILAPFFPPRVVQCVRHHVDAKRYLCATRPKYFNRLSPASVHTLGLQGGPMNKDEIATFKGRANREAIIKVRIWDEAAKVTGQPTPTFEHYAPILQRVVDIHASMYL